MKEGVEKHSHETYTKESVAISQEFVQSEIRYIYGYYKKLDLWTITEGLCLFVEPFLIHPLEPRILNNDFEDYMSYESKYDFKLLKRGVESGSLKVHSYEPQNNLDSKATKESGSLCEKFLPSWHLSIGRLKVSPFEFLEFFKKKKLLKIPPEFEFRKNVSKSGEVQYFWKSDFEENNTSKSLDPLSNVIELEPYGNDDLSGKEKQELGRLRAEKAAMDATVKAAIEVGQFIQQKTGKGEKLIRKEIEDFVYNIDKNLPDTRVDFIWKCVPDDFKKGGGRPKKTHK